MESLRKRLELAYPPGGTGRGDDDDDRADVGRIGVAAAAAVGVDGSHRRTGRRSAAVAAELPVREDGAAVPRSAPAVLVEEEPAHELYANLCGIGASTHRSATSTAGGDARARGGSPSSSGRGHLMSSYHSCSASGSEAPAPRRAGGDRAPADVAVVPADEELEEAKHEDDGGNGEVFSTSRAFPEPAAASASVAEHLRMALSNRNPSPALSNLTLNGTNCHRGFALLTRMGWRESDGGLGRRRQGGLIPVRTRLPNPKRPRAGLGVRGGLGRARVTQKVVNPGGKGAVATSAAEGGGGDPTSTRAARRAMARREAERERGRDRRIRMMLRTDVSSEYQELYLKLHRSDR